MHFSFSLISYVGRKAIYNIIKLNLHYTRAVLQKGHPRKLIELGDLATDDAIGKVASAIGGQEGTGIVGIDVSTVRRIVRIDRRRRRCSRVRKSALVRIGLVSVVGSSGCARPRNAAYQWTSVLEATLALPQKTNDFGIVLSVDHEI